MTEPELKPCPFCDSRDIKLMRDNNATRYTHRVICMNCGVSTQGTTYINDEYNISCWNRRGGKSIIRGMRAETIIVDEVVK